MSQGERGILHGLEYRSDQAWILRVRRGEAHHYRGIASVTRSDSASQWRGLIGNALDFSEVLGINLGELSSKLSSIESVAPWRYDEIISHDLRQRYGFRIS